MAEDLQQLLDRIQQDGVDKAQAEADRILKQAEARAKAIREDAEEQRQARLQEAEEDAAQLEARGRRALEQAARDTVLTVARQLEKLMQGALQAEVGRALEGEALAGLVARVVEGYSRDGAGVDVLVREEDREAVKAAVTNHLKGAAADGITIRAERGLSQGFRVALDDGRVTHDFSAQAVAESLAGLLRPYLAEITRGAVDGD